MRFTDRSLRIIRNAEREAERTTKVVYPVHLLLGLLHEKTSVCADLYINYPNLKDILNERIKKSQVNMKDEGIGYASFTVKISQTTKMVMENASGRMKRFKQIYINEGHIVDAIFKINDPLTRAIFDKVDVSYILEIISYPRDMIVSLRDYSFPTMQKGHMIFRKAANSDRESLEKFVENEFGTGWLNSIENGFLQKSIPIFIALRNQEIVGFACFDVVRNKKGLFGPMGTSYSKRTQRIGYTLLHYCLAEMKEIGYEYAVIGEVGPLEFYEKACNAVIIPK